ncbi:hypothetical protein [Paludisphaera rhizosphaerae]|uniref:hypothetical protein n=1 Tax=Paludisphaera rhizosphaerae TaxID=2711216 RepID=UPI0013EAD1E8|nr:hypothetical protein [Paludisphaera rhizosphaerae]
MDERPPWYTGDRILEAAHELESEFEQVIESFRSSRPVSPARWEQIQALGEDLHRRGVAAYASLDLQSLALLAVVDPTKPPEPAPAYDAFVRARMAIVRLINAHIAADDGSTLPGLEASSEWEIEVIESDYTCSDEDVPCTIADLVAAGYRKLTVRQLADMTGVGACPFKEMVPRAVRAGEMKGWRWRLLGGGRGQMLYIRLASTSRRPVESVDSTSLLVES